MKTPEDFGGLTGVLNSGMVIVVCLYTAFGFFGYIKYGDAVNSVVTLNLPSNEWYVKPKLIIWLETIWYPYPPKTKIKVGNFCINPNSRLVCIRQQTP